MAKIIRNVYAPVFAIILFGMFTADVALAQQEDYKEYTVKKGDTLWDISSKEIIDPFLWPKVWKENPEVKNPDLIYPGQKIRIPLYLLQKQVSPPPPVEKAMPAPEIKPPVRKEEPAVIIPPVEKDYLVDKDTFTSSGYIADAIDSKGTLIGAPTERTLLGKDDYAYVRTANPVKKGDRFYIIRSLGKVKHPETGRMMGYLIDVRGIAEVVGKESGEIKVKIPASYSDILVGDLLTDFYDMEPPYLLDKPRTPDLSGYIVATKHRRTANGQLDIVFLDKGQKDGLEIGDVFEMTARAKYDIPNGQVQVINLRDATSAAIVRKSGKEVSVGDLVGASASEQ
jgi:LysM repeat protein